MKTLPDNPNVEIVVETPEVTVTRSCAGTVLLAVGDGSRFDVAVAELLSEGCHGNGVARAVEDNDGRSYDGKVWKLWPTCPGAGAYNHVCTARE